MNIADLARAPIRYKPWRARHAALIGDSVRGLVMPAQPHPVHLAAAVDWLCRAQDVRDGHPDAGGVSAGWSFEDGWLPGYPETTGYIIETMLAAAPLLQRPGLVGRAQRMIDWELSIQRADGAFPGHFGEPGSRPVIFNTGQVMHGMLAGHLQLGRTECLESAVRAGHWLVAAGPTRLRAGAPRSMSRFMILRLSLGWMLSRDRPTGSATPATARHRECPAFRFGCPVSADWPASKSS